MCPLNSQAVFRVGVLNLEPVPRYFTEPNSGYNRIVDEKIRTYTAQFPSLLKLEATPPLCQSISLVSGYTGNAREAKCPCCLHSFVPQPGDLIQALYARAGLGA